MRSGRNNRTAVLAAALLLAYLPAALPAETERLAGVTLSLDGDAWLLAIDPDNQGRKNKWPEQPRPEARPTRVPWIIQDVFPDYHGVAWYWRYFEAPANPHPQGRFLIRFWAVDYLAEVWVNGVFIGRHEGGETPFKLDATRALKAGARNLIAVRVLNPGDDPIEGIKLSQTPHRNKTSAFTSGCDYNHGGIEDSVELLVTPAVYVEDVFVRANPATAKVSVQITVRNTLAKPARGSLELTLAPAAAAETIALQQEPCRFPSGESRWDRELDVGPPGQARARLWELNDPFLYRVTTRVSAARSASVHEQTVRCGFRDFRLRDGYFRLNGRRLYLRASVSGNMSPIGIHVPYEPDWLRRDLINVKAMGFNAVRFYGLPTRMQLDLCDEIGLLVYEEPYSSQLYEDSPQMPARFDQSTVEMIRRDRNHPSVVIWGLLNETGESPQFRHAVSALSLIRSNDESRVVLLSSGRFDRDLSIGSIANPGSTEWEHLLGDERAGGPKTKPTPVPAYIEGVGDAHAYPTVPHTAADIQFLRTLGQQTKPVFLSEYGIGSALDLPRMVRQYEQRGKGDSGEGRFYRQALDRFLVDWKRWHLEECFGRPEDYFTHCLSAMGHDRWVGLNAVRANPHLVGYSLTGTVDQGYTGEGLTTAFRELKPGTVDAMFDALAPLRWSLFVEPVTAYRATKLKFEAVLANEDVLAPGEYPVRFDLFGPDATRVFTRTTMVRIPGTSAKVEPPFAQRVFAEEIAADWPAGEYRFVAAFERGAAAAGGRATVHVVDPESWPRVERPVVLWGEDRELRQWLARREIQVRDYNASEQQERELILVGQGVAAPGGAQAFKELARHVARGSAAVFLDPNVFATAGQPANLSWIGKQGTLIHLPNNVYHKEDWAKRHAVFEGLPAGGLLDYTIYRELIPNVGWSRSDAPAEALAGAIYAFTAYNSGLLISLDRFDAGQVILNTLRLRENLGSSPAADRLVLNLLRFAGRNLAQPLAALPDDFETRFSTSASKNQ